MERAYEKRNLKLVDELLQKMDALEETLGPEYIALMDGLADIDRKKDKLGAEIMSVFDPARQVVYEVSLENRKHRQRHA